MSVESSISYQLNKHPALKKAAKRIYQKGMCAISHSFSSEGNIARVSPNDNLEYFFGYYDKSPWDASGRYMLCMRAKNTWSDVAPLEPADILLIDTQSDNSVRIIATTHTWNVQQGSMAQWRGPGFDREIIYNDYRCDHYCSIILDIVSMTERILPMPVYTVSTDGITALSLDFSRLHRLRPGYGYANLTDLTKNEKIPDVDCVWKIDLNNGEILPVIKYTELAAFEPRPEMQEAEHKVNHLMLSPNGKRFMMLHRWFSGHRKYTRLLTCNIDGTELYNLSDDDMVSHCCWKNDYEILAFANKRNEGTGYYLMRDKTKEYSRMWPELTGDGHPSYSPDGMLVVTDTYPNRRRIAEVRVMQGDVNQPVARVFAPFRYDNDTRCDLHPRWSRDGHKICFDAVFEGRRGLYTVDVAALKKSEKVFTGKVNIIYLMTGCRKRGPANQTLNLIKNLDTTIFNPILCTLYSETPGDSMLESYIPQVKQYYSLRSSLRRLFTGDKKRLYKLLDQISPAIIHTVGLFPAYFLLGYKKCVHCTTVRNDIYKDYPSKYGQLKGAIMKHLNIRVIKKCRYVITCSDSLSTLYRKKLRCKLPFICNGVDTDKFLSIQGDKAVIRNKLSLPENKHIIVYTGAFVDFKDQEFAIKGFLQCKHFHESCLVLLGDGVLLNDLKQKYSNYTNIIFTGFVTNICEYLQAADMFLSVSQSEGMPNGVLEALSCDLPVLLSNIPQHLEILRANRDIGFEYTLGDYSDFVKKLDNMLDSDLNAGNKIFRNTVLAEFSAKKMSECYQKYYLEMLKM